MTGRVRGAVTTSTCDSALRCRRMDFVLHSTILRATNQPQEEILFVYGRGVPSSEMTYFDKLLEADLMQGPIKSYNRTTKTISLWNGTRIVERQISRGGDRLRGYHPDVIIVVGELEDSSLLRDVIYPMLSSNDAELLRLPLK